MPERLDWTSAHLYFSGSIYGEEADSILRNTVAPIVSGAKAAGAVRWFFVRYSDLGPHVRLRIRARSRIIGKTVQPLIRELAQEGGCKLRWESYVPELVRYGGSRGITTSERLFYVSSETALSTVMDDRCDRSCRLGRSLLYMVMMAYAFCHDRESAVGFLAAYGQAYAQAVWGTHLETQTRGMEELILRQRDIVIPRVTKFWSDLEARALSDMDNRYFEALLALKAAMQRAARHRHLRPLPGVHGQHKTMSLIAEAHTHMMNNRLGVPIAEEVYLGMLAADGLAEDRSTVRDRVSSA